MSESNLVDCKVVEPFYDRCERLKSRLAAVGIANWPGSNKDRNRIVQAMAKQCGLFKNLKRAFNYAWFNKTKYPYDRTKAFDEALIREYVGVYFVWPPALLGPAELLPEAMSAEDELLIPETDVELPIPETDVELPIPETAATSTQSPPSTAPVMPKRRGFVYAGDTTRPPCPHYFCNFAPSTSPRVNCVRCRQWWHRKCVSDPVDDEALFVCPRGCENRYKVPPEVLELINAGRSKMLARPRAAVVESEEEEENDDEWEEIKKKPKCMIPI